MSRPLVAALAASLCLTAACLDAGPTIQTLDFYLTDPGIGDGWEVGAADYPVGREADVAVVGDRRPLPASVSTTASAVYQAGTNVTGDLFVFQKRFWTGLLPGTYGVSIEVEFVSNVHSGCTTGIGPGVVIKAGITTTEPRADADGQGIYRMSFNKGTGTSGGDFAQVGDIRNGLAGCPATGTYAIRSTSMVRQSVDLVTSSGNFWMFVGTQSSFLARHEIYITRVSVSFALK